MCVISCRVGSSLTLGLWQTLDFLGVPPWKTRGQAWDGGSEQKKLQKILKKTCIKSCLSLKVILAIVDYISCIKFCTIFS